ncbi:hypothetical protein OH77DRAFT_1525866 [Trametes cingulata]|nr:hypothetical protein OH77DRAFT_1525866 [Trametes cingulata]
MADVEQERSGTCLVNGLQNAQNHTRKPSSCHTAAAGPRPPGTTPTPPGVRAQASPAPSSSSAFIATRHVRRASRSSLGRRRMVRVCARPRIPTTRGCSSSVSCTARRVRLAAGVTGIEHVVRGDFKGPDPAPPARIPSPDPLLARSLRPALNTLGHAAGDSVHRFATLTQTHARVLGTREPPAPSSMSGAEPRPRPLEPGRRRPRPRERVRVHVSLSAADGRTRELG